MTGVFSRYQGWIWLAIVSLAVWPTLVSFHDVWTSYTYSHGYVAAVVVLWFGWRSLRHGIPGERDDLSALAPFAIVGLSLLWLVATVLHFRVVHQGVLPLMLVAWAAMVGGRHGALWVVPPASLALFAVPFWEVFVPPLQALTVLVSGSVVHLMGIGAEISGDIIEIPSGRFEVAGSCSGLSFFIVGGFLAATYAYLFVESWRGRAKVVLLAAATAMVANWVRVIGLVGIGHVTQMQHSLMTEHGAYGWVIFGLFMGGWLWLLERRESRAVSLSKQVAQEVASFRTGWNRRSHLAIGLVLMGPGIYWVVSALPPRSIDTYASDVIPSDEWVVQGVDESKVSWGPRYPEADSHRRWVVSRDSVTVLVDRVTYLEQEQGRELVDSANRLVEGDWIAGERTRWVPGLERMVREMLVAAPEGSTLLWSWYEVGGRATAAPAWAQLLALPGFFLRRVGAEVVVYRTACVSTSCSEAAKRLEEMLSYVLNRAR